MKHTLSTENLQAFSSVANIARTHFTDEEATKFNTVIDKINGAELKGDKYEVELSKDEEAAINELLTLINDKYEDIKKSSRFQDLKKLFSTERAK